MATKIFEAAAEAWQRVASTPDGSAILSDFALRFGFQRQSTYKLGEPPTDCVYREGQRSVMVHLHHLLSHVPTDEPAAELTPQEITNVR